MIDVNYTSLHSLVVFLFYLVALMLETSLKCHT